MAKRIKFINTYHDAGKPKYVAGKHYPKTPETHSQVIAGNAEEIDLEDVDADDPPGDAPPADTTKAAADTKADPKAQADPKAKAGKPAPKAE